MADKEHRAAKAGRYVRAAGIVIGKEIDRRATAAAAKPIPVRPAPPPPPPPFPTTDLLGKLAFSSFTVSLCAFGIVVLHFETLLPGTAKTVARLVLGAIMLAEAFLLTSNWKDANQRVGQRLLTRIWGPRGPMNRREKTFARIVRDVLALVGIAFLAAGVYVVLVATIGVD